MTDALEKFSELKKRVAKARRKADERQGQLNEVVATLKKEFGCASIAEAEKLGKELRKKVDEKEAKFAKDLKRWEERWGEAL